MAPIFIIDSGFGGLSISSAIKQRLPDLSQIYCLDNHCFPYGTKSEQFVAQRVAELVGIWAQQTELSAVVVACNTASTTVLPKLRAQFDCPIVGVVPAIKPAAEASQTKVIALLATEGTVSREYTQSLIADFADGSEVIQIGSEALVEIAEAELRNEAVTSLDYIDALEPLLTHPLSPKVDQVVLGCTHFPLIKKRLAEICPEHWQWVDSSEAIARRVDTLLSPIKQTADAQFSAVLTEPNAQMREVLRTFGYSIFD